MEKQSGRQLYRYLLGDIAIFSAVWLYLWFVVDIKLIYHGAGRVVDFPCFFKTSQFFLSHLSYPSGLLEYFNAFVSQMFYYSWLGAAVIALVVWLSAVFINNVLSKVDMSAWSFLRFLPALMAMMTFSQYKYHFPLFVAMMVVLAFVNFYLSFRIKNSFLDLAVLVFLSVVLYTVVGGAFLVFAGLVLLCRLLKSWNFLITVVFVVSAILIPYLVGVLLFKDSLNNVYSRQMPFSWKILSVEPNRMYLVWGYVLYFALPLVMFFHYIYALKKNGPTKFPGLKAKIVSLFKQLPVKAGLVLVVFACVYFFVFDSSQKVIFQVDYHLVNGNYAKVVSCVRRFPTRNYFVSNSLNQALYHEGRLGEEMFKFPQHPFVLFLNEESYVSVHWPKIKLLMDLGFVNYAEHEAVESLEKFGPRPYILKSVIISLLAKGNYSTAKVYLNQLTKTIFEHKWADDYIERLKTDPDLGKDQRIQVLRKNMVSDNYGFSSFPIDKLLVSLLQKNPKNKMAFEYLMTRYLLYGKIEKVIENFDMMRSLGYERLCESYQQAYLLHTKAMGQKASLGGYSIEPEVLRRSREAIGCFNMLRAGDAKGLQILTEKYSDTYIYYFISLPSMMQK